MSELTVTKSFRVRRERHGRKRIKAGKEPEDADRVPRVARLMALALRFDQLIQDGAAKDQAELARLGRVTRARLSQIMNLLNLAPTIQESILISTAGDAEFRSLTERALRVVLRRNDWRCQIQIWERIIGGLIRAGDNKI